MANSVKKMPVQQEEKPGQHLATSDMWRPFEKLRQQVDHLFEDFNRGSLSTPFGRGLFDAEPFWRRELISRNVPAVDISDKEKATKSRPNFPAWMKKTSRSNCPMAA